MGTYILKKCSNEKKNANRADRVKFKGIRTKANYHLQIIRFTVFVLSFYFTGCV